MSRLLSCILFNWDYYGLTIVIYLFIFFLLLLSEKLPLCFYLLLLLDGLAGCYPFT